MFIVTLVLLPALALADHAVPAYGVPAYGAPAYCRETETSVHAEVRGLSICSHLEGELGEI